ncbi:hypothetical protein K7X08_025996 [Anisodus acutangulus]|uniref:EF-hand domain-containing protein n=1 Tax=Anisodus acutangulus TaxID=402998 RepID=A0A9Q1RVE6_9SOLA|nr:hypothetical protein K7X08_025996 [Anisodus acutangulus]
MYAAFSYFDQDSSGYITKDELQQACEKFGMSNIPIEELMREVDQDNVLPFSTLDSSFDSLNVKKFLCRFCC